MSRTDTRSTSRRPISMASGDFCVMSVNFRASASTVHWNGRTEVQEVDPFELTRRLISIPSVTGTEQAVGEFLASHLASLGYRVERQNVAADRFNIFAFAGDAR